jgi:hypothetical protein
MSVFWGALLTVAATGVAIVAMLLVRRRAPEGSFFEDGDRASGVFGVLATGFAILLGLIVVLAFDGYDRSRSGAETEALTVVQQFQTAQFMPEAAGARLGDELVCYARAVIYQEWPQQEDGGLPDTIRPWAVAMFRTLETVEPEAASEQSAYDKWGDQTTQRELAANDRAHGADGVVPWQLWLVMFLIAGIIFTYVLFFADRGERWFVQALLMGSVVAVITLTLLLIRSLDEPFHPGPGAVKPVAMQRTLNLLEQQRQVVGQTGPLPCDEAGAVLGQ